MTDLIPRAAARDVINTWGLQINKDVRMKLLHEDLNAIPTVDVAPVVHGQWIGVEYDGYADGCPVYDVWECSKCGEWHKGEYDTLSKYCPNCGAKMNGEGD